MTPSNQHALKPVGINRSKPNLLRPLALLVMLVGSGLANASQTAIDVQAPSTAAAAVDAAATTDRMIIKYRAGSAAALRPNIVSMARAHEVVNRAGVQMTRLRGNALSAHVMVLDRQISTATAYYLAQEIMRSDATVDYAEPDLRVQHQLVPTDPGYLSQWSYYEPKAGLNLPTAWNSATGVIPKGFFPISPMSFPISQGSPAESIVVAVVDTGYRPHADLLANLLPGYDFVTSASMANDGGGRDSDAKDPGDWAVAGGCYPGSPPANSSWHGTHVAGTVAAATNNGLGVAGVAFNAKVLPVRVLGKCGGYGSDIADGIIWAAGGAVPAVPTNTTPARVINLSLGGGGSCGTTMQESITMARSLRAVVVVAAGNSSGSTANVMPANCHGVTTVAAVNRSGGRAWYSNFGSAVDVAAPGGDTRFTPLDGILSTLNNGTTSPGADVYAYYQGTSMATPHVAGVAALMMSRNPWLSVEQVEGLLRSSVRSFPAACVGCGTGLVDASLAVAGAAATQFPMRGLVSEVEPNDTAATAQSVNSNVDVNGALLSTTDVDYFRVTVAAGKTLTAVLRPNAKADPYLTLHAANGSPLVTSNHAGNGVTETIVYSNNSGAALVYLVAVRYGSGAIGSYHLGLTQ